jgi:hypothetical protein
MSHEAHPDQDLPVTVKPSLVYEIRDNTSSGRTRRALKLSRNITTPLSNSSVENIFNRETLYFLEFTQGEKNYGLAVSDEDMQFFVRGYLALHNQYLAEGEQGTSNGV